MSSFQLMSKYNFQRLSYFCILLGAVMLIYDMTQEEELLLLKVLGIVILMFGLYGISTGIKSKDNKEEEHD